MQLVFTHSNTLLNSQKEDERNSVFQVFTQNCLRGLAVRMSERRESNPCLQAFLVVKKCIHKNRLCCWAIQTSKCLNVHMSHVHAVRRLKRGRCYYSVITARCYSVQEQNLIRAKRIVNVCYSFMRFLKYFIMSELQLL